MREGRADVPDSHLSLPARPGATRRERREHARAVRKELERALRPRLGGASPRRHRSALTALAALLTLGVGAADAGAAVTATVTGTAPDKLLTVTTSAGDAVVVTCGGDGNIKVNGADPTPATPCADVGSASVTGDGLANSIDLTAFAGDASLNGQGGNDTLSGGTGYTTLTGGAGSDSLVHQNVGRDQLEEQVSGTTTLTDAGLTTGADTDTFSGPELWFVRLTGGAGNDDVNISTYTGIAVVDAAGGNDTLTGGSFSHFLTGGPGDDSFTDTAAAPSSAELSETGDVNMTLTATALTGVGNDTLTNILRARLDGGPGNNTIDASAFPGQVFLDGGAGNDTVRGGPSADWFMPDPGHDSLVAGGGFDRLNAEGEALAGSLTLTNTALTSTLLGNDTISSFEQVNLLGSSAADTMDASAFTGVDGVWLEGLGGADSLVGSIRDDVFVAGGGIDTVRGLAGHDEIFNLDGVPGPNSFFGDGGDDTLWGFGHTETLDGGTGVDRIEKLSAGPTVTLTNDSISEAEGVSQILSIERVVLRGDALPNTIDATQFTGSGGVSIQGQGGDDTLTGSGGPRNDTINGGSGNDRFDAFGDFDFTLTDVRLESPGTGLDTLTAVESVSLTGGAGNNLLDASAATTRTTTLRGGGGNDTLRGGALADFLDGGDGIDDYFGNAGDDTLFTEDSLAEATIFCGSGANLVTADAADTLAADCPARPVPAPTPAPTASPVAPPTPIPPARPATPFVDPAAGVADLALACTSDRIVLIDVVPAQKKVRVTGAATPELRGAPLIVKLGSKRVGKATVGADRLFAASVPAPKGSTAATARYSVQAGARKSKALKLTRRLIVSSTSATATSVTIKGRVVKPLAAKQLPVVFKRQTSCTGYETVGSAKVARSGAFTAKLPRPVAAQAAVYRGETKVPAKKGAKKVTPTFTLPRAVGLR
jgi:Ca2+-binding RTX toxin-like protein